MQHPGALGSGEHQTFVSPEGEGRISLVIPVLNEETCLPRLLDTVDRQTVQPQEVIVVDGGSTDGTHAIAQERASMLLKGGSLPGISRNYGAEWASAEWLLFLDADVRLPQDALEVAMQQVRDRSLDAVSCAFTPDRRDPGVRLHHWLSSEYFWLTSKVGWCHSIGAFLLVRRELHNRIGGFDHTVHVAEDQDYVLRLNRAGRYAYLRRPVVEVATRRFDRQGMLRMSAKWFGIEAHRLLLGEIRDNRFDYFS